MNNSLKKTCSLLCAPAMTAAAVILGGQTVGATVVLAPDEIVGTAADAWSATDPGLENWLYGDIRSSGTVGITRTYDNTSAETAISAPGSSGSLEFELTESADKAGINMYFATPIPLADLDGAGYDWLRSSASTNPDTQSPALFFWFDADGDTGTGGDTYGIKYEAIYNGVTPGTVEDVWQTAVIDDTTNLWSWNAPGDTFEFNLTLAYWKSTYPAAVITGMGIDAGSGWNGYYSGAADFVVLDLPGADNDAFYDFQVEAPRVVIDGCDTGVIDHITYGGLSISDLIDLCAAAAKNHGQFVKCVAELANDLKKDGIITGAEKGALVSCAAQAALP